VSVLALSDLLGRTLGLGLLRPLVQLAGRFTLENTLGHLDLLISRLWTGGARKATGFRADGLDDSIV
jgi:hypothetical protein